MVPPLKLRLTLQASSTPIPTSKSKKGNGKNKPQPKLRLALRSKANNEDNPSTSLSPSTPTPELPQQETTGGKQPRKRNWRDKAKTNEKLYEKMKEMEAAYSANYRMNLEGEKKKRSNELAKYRMREFRQREREKEDKNKQKKNKKAKPTVKKGGTFTRSGEQELVKKRGYERLKKQRQRAKWPQAKKDEVNARRRERRHQKNLELLELRRQRREMAEELKRQEDEKRRLLEERKKFEEESEQIIEEEVRKSLMKGGNERRSGGAKRKSLSRAYNGFPKSPSKFACTISDVLDKALKSPRKAAALDAQGLSNVKVNHAVATSLTNSLKSIKTSRKKKDVEEKRSLVKMLATLKKNRLQRRGCQQFGVSRKAVKSSTSGQRRKFTSKITPETKQAVIKFYEENSIQLPDKKFISKKTLKKTGFLQEPIRILFSRFRNQYPDIRIGLTRFTTLRPIHIKKQSQIKFRGCLCEYCTHLELKAQR